MRILGISGSLRRDSHNTALLRAAADVLSPGAELEIFEGLRDVPPYDADMDSPELQGPGVDALKEAIERADGLLFACPEYNGGMTGVLKNAVDWASRLGKTRKVAALTGKTICIIGASPGMTGTVRAQDQLRLVLRRAGARSEPQGDVLVFQAHTKIIDGRLADERTREALGRHLAGFAERLAATSKDI